MQPDLLSNAQAIAPGLLDVFFTLHRHPELGRGETATAALIRRRLDKLGIEYAPYADTGTVGIIRGGRPGRVLGFRADMDALPICEETGLPYASQVPGVMHACGHDFHVAALLGAAEMLAARRAELAGAVKLFFQPDEEGDGGAARMIREGCMDDPAVDAVLCCHVDSGIPTGTVSLRTGPICAASNMFTITLRGRGTHGAKPHLGNDVIVAGAQLVTALQTISSRRLDPAEPVVATVGSFHSGDAGNVLPETAVLKGILRTMGEPARSQAVDSLRSITMGIAAAMGVTTQVDVVESYPACNNDTALTELVRGAAESLLGRENVLELPAPGMGTDDFGYFSAAVPGCYYYIGVGNAEKGFTYPNHNPHFAVDTDALPIAVALHAQTAIDFLKEREV